MRPDAAYRRVNNAMMSGLGPDDEGDDDDIIRMSSKNLKRILLKAMGLILSTIGDGPLVQIEHGSYDDLTGRAKFITAFDVLRNMYYNQ